MTYGAAELFAQMKQADRDYTEDHGIGDLEDWDEMLECEVKHFNRMFGTDFDPKEMRIQYIEKFEVQGY